MSPSADQPFILGDWRVDPSTGVVRRGDEVRRLEPKVMDVLVHLVRANGRLVSKEELFESVWNGTAVSDDVLRRCIYNLRQALGDDSENPRYVRTWPRRGYTLEATVVEERPAAAPQTRPGVSREKASRPSRQLRAAFPAAS